MKKFVFALDPLYKVKLTMKDKLQAEYSAAVAAYDEACRQRDRIREQIESETRKFEIKAKNGMTVADMQAYSRFLEDLQNMETAACNRAELARREANRKQTELIGIFKEVKVLEKLREKQYQEYLTEEEKEEKNVIEDILSFDIVGKTP